MSPALEVRDASFKYGERSVLDNATLTVGRGEMVALLGANGAGKTTLLRLASGVSAPFSGEVLLFGRRLGDMRRREVARAVAVMPQDSAIPPGWSVEEVVGLSRTPHIGLLRGESAADRRAVAEALAVTGLDAFVGRGFDSLSGGERQMALVALAIAQETDLILLDEPTAHLDLRRRADVLDAVQDLNERRGVAVLAAMHDPILAALYFDRIVLLAEGRVLADGPPGETLTEPLLEKVYNARVRVLHDDELGVPLATVLPRRAHLGTGKNATAAGQAAHRRRSESNPHT